MVYTDLIAQIADLTKQAEKAKKDEYSSVIKDLKKTIAAYGITAADLGFTSTKKMAPSKSSKRSKSAVRKIRKPVPVKYRDTNGNTWSGRGKQPRWVSSFVASGGSLESLLV